ncbi:TIGR02996 domain-containing protein [Gemmata sp.]|uniref:TIGR02996 domain-containing protein n=1 Tax=Gemmata sp. TaxID=1914242 RepID=UPI003F6F1A11
MSDGVALRRAVLAEPDEDLPRLAFADWLDENGRAARAELVRAQIEVARAEPFAPAARAAAARAGELLDAHGTEWRGDFRAAVQESLGDDEAVHVSGTLAAPLPGVVRVQVQFERGFIGHVALQSDVFVRVADAVFEAEPVQSLRIERTPGLPDAWESLEPVFEVGHLARVRRLEFAPRTEFVHDEYVAILGAAHLGGLTDLVIRECPVQPPWVVDLLRGGALPALRGLALVDNPHLGSALTAGLAAANHRDLRRLDASGVVLSADQLRNVLTSRCLRRVAELRLGCASRPGSPGPLFHVNPGWVLPLDHLVVLDLNGQRLGNSNVGEILRQPAAAALRCLGLARNDLDAGVVRAFVESKHLNLNHLDVRGNGFTPSNLAALRGRFPGAVVQV